MKKSTFQLICNEGALRNQIRRNHWTSLIGILLLSLSCMQSFGQSIDQVQILEQLTTGGPTVTTDKPDYSPAETALIFAEGFTPGETVEFLVLHIGGKPNTGKGHTPWKVTDGGPNDFDGLINGKIRTSWFVDPDDSFNSVFMLTAKGLSSGLEANHQFLDDTPVPTDVSAIYNGIASTLEVCIDWQWLGSPNTKKVVAAAVFADLNGDGILPVFIHPTNPNNNYVIEPADYLANGYTGFPSGMTALDEYLGQYSNGLIEGRTNSGADSTSGGIAEQAIGSTLPHVLFPYDLQPQICQGANGSFCITYTGVPVTPTTVCAVTYDVHIDDQTPCSDPPDISNIKDLSGNHSPISAGPNYNEDNSLEDGNSNTNNGDPFGCTGLIPFNCDIVNIMPTCLGMSDGSFDLTLSGGTTSNSYSVSGPTSVPAGTIGDGDTVTINGLSEGMYTVLVTDANGAMTQCGVMINSTSSLSLDAVIIKVDCQSDTASVNITTTGGNGPYAYDWDHISGSPNPEDLTGVSSGTYCVTVTDANGCQTDTCVYLSPAVDIDASCADNLFFETFGTEIHDPMNATGTFSYDISSLVCGNVEELYIEVYAKGNENLMEDNLIIDTDAPGSIPSQIQGIDLCRCDASPCGNHRGRVYCMTLANASNVSTINLSIPGGGTNDYFEAITVYSVCSASETCTGGGAIIEPEYLYQCVDAEVQTLPVMTDSITVNIPFAELSGDNRKLCARIQFGSVDITKDVKDYFAIPTGTQHFYGIFKCPIKSTTLSNTVTISVIACGNSSGDCATSSCTGNSQSVIIGTIITQYRCPNSLDITCSNTKPSCFGYADGSMNVTANGQPPYSYAYTGPSSGNGSSGSPISITGLSAGTYHITVTDDRGCRSTCSQNISQPTLLTATCNSVPANGSLDCNGDTDGSVSVVAGGGTAGYTYQWNNAATTNSITGLGAGTYTVTVTDSKGCTATCSKTLTQPTPVTATCTPVPANGILDCHGDMDGSVSVVAGGGTAGYTYVWSNAATTNNITGLGAGTYTVTVTDSKGCTATCGKTITQPTPVTAICTAVPANGLLDCHGDTDGSVSVVAGGGTAGYTYVWSNAATTNSITGLGVGTYTVTVTDSKGCTASCSKTITQPTPVTAICNSVPANGLLDCHGDSDGSVSVIAGGGTAGYTYVWSNAATTSSITGLGVGTYSVTVTDSKGCTATCSKTITQPTPVTATCTPVPANGILDCHGDTDGSVSVVAGGGTAGYTYQWSNSATTTSITGLGAGTYTVTVTDSKGCTATCDKTITQPTPVTAICTAVPANGLLDCHGDTDGSVSVVAGGGTPGYTYVWSNTATTNSITGLGAGTYTVTVTDSKGCTARCSKTITQPTPVTAICTAVPANGLLDCHGDMDGGVSVVAGGGTAGYTYVWSNAATTSSITGLGVGTYTVTVTDSKGCTASCSKTISQPTPVTAICNSVPANGLLDCHGDTDGSVSVVAGGGTAAYTYLWSNAATTNNITGLGAGTYIVTVTDSKGCTATCSKTITQPTLLACSIVGTDVGCNTTNTGSADASVTGGTMPYTYLWSNGATTQDITGLSVGSYTLSVTDANNCLSTCDVNIGGFVCSIAPTVCDLNNLRGAVSTVTGGTPPYTYLWSTGETTSTIQGLIPGIYDLLVSDAQECETQCQVIIDRCITCDGICGTTFARLDGYEQCFDQFGFSQWGWTNGVLGQGNYTFDLYSEALLCDLNNGVLVGELLIDYELDTVIVTYNLFGDYTMSLSSLYIGCTDLPNNNGAQTVSPSQYPYQQFHDDVTTYTYVVDISNLVCEGIYVIAHAETCLPNDFSCSITGTSVDCNGGSTGMADATVTGGMPPYRYLWSNGQTTEDISGLTAGLYTLNATDENNCLTVCEVRITYPSMPAPQIGPFCQNDVPYDLSDLLTDPNLMGSWIGSGVSDDIFYPSALTVGMHDIYYEDEINCVSAMISIFVDERCCPPDYSEANGRKLIGIQSHAVHYETDGILDSDQIINANTIYDSKLQINLLPEFEVKLGSEFSALFDGCP